MTNQRLPYSDAASLPEMAEDCSQVEHNLHLPRRVDSVPHQFLGEHQAPVSARLHSRYDVPDDLAHLVEGLELHFD